MVELPISHFGVFSENAEEAFVGAFEDVIGPVIVEIRPESLGGQKRADCVFLHFDIFVHCNKRLSTLF